MKRKLFIIPIFAALLFSKPSFCQKSSLNDSILKLMKSKALFKEAIYKFKGKKLPEFNLSLLNGKKLNSESLKGKPTVLNFWFIECPPCLEEIPLFNEIKSEFNDDVNFIAVTFHSKDKVKEFLNENNFDFTHIIDSKEYIDKFGRFGYPKTLIIDGNLEIKQIEKMIPRDIDNFEENKIKLKKRIVSKLRELKTN